MFTAWTKCNHSVTAWSRMHLPIFKNWYNYAKWKSLEASSLPTFLCLKNVCKACYSFNMWLWIGQWCTDFVEIIFFTFLGIYWFFRSFISYTPILLTPWSPSIFLSLLQFTTTKNFNKRNKSKQNKQAKKQTKTKQKTLFPSSWWHWQPWGIT